jgi:segregation and condensation protein B
MDEISRDLPADATSPRAASTATKGPEELAQFERATIAADLVVRDRLGGVVADMSAVEPEAEPAEPAPAGSTAGEPADTSGPAAANDEAAANETALPSTADELVADTPIDASEAAAAIAAEGEVAEIEEDLADDEGLPAVPELGDAAAVARAVFVLMLTSREGLSVLRLAQACNTSQKLVEEALTLLRGQLQTLDLPVELARTGDTVKWMSGAETFPYLQRLRGVKKLEKLSPAALETLAVIAYRQPVMRGEIEAIRGVKAGPMLRTLLHHKLVKVTGRADVPGRPLQYGTTQQFLERFGLGSLQELPSIKEWKSLG